MTDDQRIVRCVYRALDGLPPVLGLKPPGSILWRIATIILTACKTASCDPVMLARLSATPVDQVEFYLARARKFRIIRAGQIRQRWTSESVGDVAFVLDVLTLADVCDRGGNQDEIATRKARYRHRVTSGHCGLCGRPNDRAGVTCSACVASSNRSAERRKTRGHALTHLIEVPDDRILYRMNESQRDAAIKVLGK